jgi:thioredoxin reductase (NADPH)
MRGISGCAVCDGALPIFRDKVLAVVGGGDVAMEEALHLAKFGSEVIILIRRGIPDLKASKAMQQRVFDHDKIRIMEYTEVASVHGDEVVDHLRITNNQSNQTERLDVGGLFFAIGHTPNTSFLDGQLELDDSGYIITTP